MEAKFWHQRWQDQLIGFHQAEINPHLVRFWPLLELSTDATVLVPLCGKSLDMLWLRDKGYAVIGVELSPVATAAFFSENHLTPEYDTQGSFNICETDGLRLYCGDFFELTSAQINDVKAVYDRASLIALPGEMRPRFVDKLNEVLAGKAISMLLVTLEYEQKEMNGPPFSVEQQEVEELFRLDWEIQLMQRTDVLASEPKFRDRGLSRMSEAVYLLRQR